MAKKTIMVVDDEAPITKVVSEVLSPEGYKVIEANSGPEALEKMRKNKPDLVLLDFFMPGMSGRDVCEEIRKDPNLKDLKVAFLTIATFSAAGAKELKKMNVLEYIKKPFEYKELIKRIKELVGQ